MIKSDNSLILFLLTLITFPWFYAAAADLPSPEKLKFERFGIRQGFHQGIVNCIFQDRKDFMWFGTGDGLNKYDGYNFTVYKHRYNDPNTPGHKNIRCIHQDREGLLWLGTVNGLEKFDKEKGTFILDPYFANVSKEFKNPAVGLMCESPPGILWFCTANNGLFKYDFRGKEMTRFINDPDNPNSIINNYVNFIHQSRLEPGILWLATRNGLDKFDPIK